LGWPLAQRAFQNVVNALPVDLQIKAWVSKLADHGLSVETTYFQADDWIIKRHNLENVPERYFP
jgi:hypothetical protein